MRNLKYRKKELIKASVAVLLLLGIGVASLKVVGDVSQTKNELATLKSQLADQGKKLKSVELDLRSINGSNGSLLGQCLDAAGRDYNNSLKSSGKVAVENGANVTYHDFNTWKGINDKFEAARAKCSAQYK